MASQDHTATALIQRPELFMAVCLRTAIQGHEPHCTWWEAPLPGRNQNLHIVHVPKTRRAGMALVGTGATGATVWTDAATPAEALAHYLAAGNQA